MNLAKSVATATIVTLTLGTQVVFAADASAPATVIGCFDMSKKVKAALDSATQSPNYDAAREQYLAARAFCLAERYQEGVSRYAKALQLLGVG